MNDWSDYLFYGFMFTLFAGLIGVLGGIALERDTVPTLIRQAGRV